ncbi:MAG: flavin reductase family protein [Candidatus Melainabacteria bacterium]|nr:flavin reductase family protein [Candidatus Melainabacteria bacterium]
MNTDVSKLQATPEYERLGLALGRVVSGVYVVTAASNGQQAGMIASWIQQVGFEPPMISMAIRPDRPLYALLQQSGRFVVHVVAKSNTELMKAFGKATDEPFTSLNVQETAYGPLLTDAVAALSCQVLEVVSPAQGDHHLVLATVAEGHPLNHSQLEPMVHLRASGFHY